MPIIYSVVVIPLVYVFLRKYMEFSRSNVLVGLALFNSCFLSHSGTYFGYGVYGYIFFIIAFSLIFHSVHKRECIVLVILATGLVAMTYPVSSYMLLFSLTLFYYLKKNAFYRSDINASSHLVILAFVMVFSWMIYVAFSVLTQTFDITKLLFKYTAFSASTSYTSKGTINDPYAGTTLLLTYLGQGIFGFVGLIGAIASFRRGKNIGIGLLWTVAAFVIGLFAFGMNWSSRQLGKVYDYRFRFVLYMFLLMIPAAMMGLKHIEPKLRNTKIGKTRNILILVLVFFMVLSSITSLSSYIYLRKTPIVANEDIVAPHKWHNIGLWSQKFMPEDSSVYGSQHAITIYALTGVHVSFDENPYYVLNQQAHPLYIVLSKFNLYLPEPTWAAESNVITKTQYLYLVGKCSTIFDSGEVWLFFRDA